MFDIYIGSVNLAGLMILLAVLALLPLQLFLCFKGKNLFLRLLPVMLAASATAVFVILFFLSEGLRSLVWMVFSIYAAIPLFLCGLGWGIWAVTRCVKKRS